MKKHKVMSIIWVAVFSYILSSIIGAWVVAWHMPQALFGMLLIAVGAEIPDTIESVTMARKGYGSMAVSNCQVKINIYVYFFFLRFLDFFGFLDSYVGILSLYFFHTFVMF